MTLEQAQPMEGKSYPTVGFLPQDSFISHSLVKD